VSTALSDLADRLSAAERLLLLTHEHPDGDAIGSLTALHRLLASVGVESDVLVAEDDEPADEYRFLVPWERVRRTLPEDLSGWTLALLDCGNRERSPLGQREPEGAFVINVDHHHDNTRFGDLDFVDPDASCTAEIVWRLREPLGATIDDPAAQALYAGLVTDTGRFMYSNTGTEAHRMAADLIELGVPVEQMYRRIYEGVQEGRVRLLAGALAGIERHEGGALTMTWLSRELFERAGASDDWSEGIIDHLRAIEGTSVAAVIREPERDPSVRRVSLRSARDGVDVSLIAREAGGGGHKGAAGFSSDLPREDLVSFLRQAVANQVGNSTVA